MKSVSLILTSVFFILVLSDSKNISKDSSGDICDECIQQETTRWCKKEECNCTGFTVNTSKIINSTEALLNRPQPKCKTENSIALHWKSTHNLTFFLEYDFRLSAKNFTEPTRCNFHTIEELIPGTRYRIRLWSISPVHKFEHSDYLEVETLELNYKPLPVQKLFLKKLNLKDGAYEAIVKWTPAEDRSCFYDFVWTANDAGEDYRHVEIRDVSKLFEITLPNLRLGINYTLLVRALSSDLMQESQKVELEIRVPSCLEAYASLDVCPPEAPKSLQLNEYIVDINIEGPNPIYDVQMTWQKPKLIPNYYTAQLMNELTNFYHNENVTFLNISGEQTTAYFRGVELGMHYQVFLTAWSKAGSSEVTVHDRFISGTRPIVTSRSSWATTDVYFIIGLLIFISIIAGAIFVIRHKFRRQNDDQIRNSKISKVEQNNHTTDTNIYGNISYTEPDEWEIDLEILEFQSVLGEGEFGIVRKGFLKMDGQNRKDVAIKMLKDTPSQAELRQYYQEIDIMKSVGLHPHLVSMIGCITKGRPFTPLLVVEYCSRGDLQTFLRNIWENLTNQSMHSDYTDMNKSLQDIGQQFSNKMYEIDTGPLIPVFDDMLQPKDLISFARQIALGMEYLSSLRVLHRDLATRNILLCEDMSVKISDFGLSRDVYTENVYCKTGSGKLPIRWMALESMTHQCYTIQSDVWSFGVVVWEIVTLGGSPYPGVTNYDLLPLLKRGYRMEKPFNCSEELYKIMLDCWKASPKDRPTFTDLRKILDALLEQVSHYLHLDMTTSNQEYFRPTRSMRESKLKVSERYVRPLA